MLSRPGSVRNPISPHSRTTQRPEQVVSSNVIRFDVPAGTGEDTYHVTCDNYFEGDLSADAMGITATLWSYSHLSFTAGSFAHCYADHYHRLREYMFEHPEVRAIMGATD